MGHGLMGVWDQEQKTRWKMYGFYLNSDSETTVALEAHI